MSTATREELTVRRAAERLGITASRLRQMIAAGDARPYAKPTEFSRTGYYWVFTEREVRRLQREREHF